MRGSSAFEWRNSSSTACRCSCWEYVQFNLTPLETITPSQGPTEPPGETGVTGLKGERGLEVNHVRSYRIHLYKSRFKGRNHKIQQMYDYKHILMQLPKIFGIRYLRLNGDRKMIRLTACVSADCSEIPRPPSYYWTGSNNSIGLPSGSSTWINGAIVNAVNINIPR